MERNQLYLFGLSKKANDERQKKKVIIPVDTLILISGVIVILCALSFSLGVNKGKKIHLANLNKKKMEKIEELGSEKKTKLASLKTVQEEVLQPKSDARNTELMKKTSEYRIQVASFLKEKSANQEAEKLKQKGYPALISKIGKYMVVYVGNFENEEIAKNNMQILRKTYKDCMLRRL